MQGYDGKISPEDSLTREEAAVMICRALGIETQETVNKTFSDYASVSDWARPYINAMVNEGLLNGSYGNLNPKNTITRSEVVTILDNAVLPILKVGEYGGIETSKILVISSGSVTLNKAKLDGKIIITQGAQKGNVTFLESEINGEVTIDNSRKGFIVLEKSTIADKDLLKNEAFVTEKKDDTDDSGSSGGPGGSSGNKGDKDNGGNTGDDNTGDNEGGNTGDDNTGDNEGGNTGDDNTGDNEGGNTGDDNTGDDEEPIDYEKINEEMVDNLQLVSDDIAMYIDPAIPDFYSVFTNEEKYILRTIKYCIDEAITYEEIRIIDAEFIKGEYDDEILELKGIYDTMQAEGRAGGFHSRLFVNLNSYTLFWLAETLGIDLSEYGINPGDYI